MMNNNSLFAIRDPERFRRQLPVASWSGTGSAFLLAGYGVAENEQMPDIAADAKAIAFGNFKRGYTIVDRIGTRILRDPYTKKPFVGFYTTKRTGECWWILRPLNCCRSALALNSLGLRPRFFEVIYA
ncbi:phage major capsid protein [Escherichia coli]|uniref:phage major capsid protein n=1 Tax=Escherichia coli TaxID=562 RepID=UPI003EE9574A